MDPTATTDRDADSTRAVRDSAHRAGLACAASVALRVGIAGVTADCAAVAAPAAWRSRIVSASRGTAERSGPLTATGAIVALPDGAPAIVLDLQAQMDDRRR